MSMTRPIPKWLRDKFATDPFFKSCCIADDECDGHIQWHHNLTNAGKRTDDEEGILPACVHHHDKASTTLIKERFDWVMLERNFERIHIKYPRSGWDLRYNYLKKKYGKMEE
jgi:hypothetical protein